MREICVVVSNSNETVTPIETIDAIKNAGYKNVFIQWYNKNLEYSQEEQLEYIKKLGLNVLFAHLGYKDINTIWEKGQYGDILVNNYKKDIDICYKNNIPMVIMHLTNNFKAPKYNIIGLNRLKEIVKYANKYNIKVAFENTKIKGYLKYVLENIKDDNVGVCYDSGHAHAYFNDKFDFQLYKNRIFAVHLHDNDKSSDQHLIPFDGTIDWNKLINNLKDSNYKGPITLELCYRNNYTKMDITEFYKKGYIIAEKLAKIIDE